MFEYHFEIYFIFMHCAFIRVNYGAVHEHGSAEAETVLNIEHKGKCAAEFCTCTDIPQWDGVECDDFNGTTLPQLLFRTFKYVPEGMFLGLRIYSVVFWHPEVNVPEHFLQGILGLEVFVAVQSSIKVVPDFRIVNDSIKVIRIESSRLTSLEGKHLQNLTKAYRLSFFDNSIRYIDPDVFWGTYNVERLNFGNNKLTSIPPKLLRPLKRLEMFHASNNNLLHVDNLFSSTRPMSWTEVGYAFAGLDELWYVGLQNNQIKSLGTLQKLINLRVLFIGQNDIKLIYPDQLPNTLQSIALEVPTFEDLTRNITLRQGTACRCPCMVEVSGDKILCRWELTNWCTGNPFKCDCKLKPFLIFLKAKKEEGNFETDTDICLPSEIESNQTKQTNCPSMCSCRCTEYGDDLSIFVDCSSRNLSSAPQFFSNILEKLEDNETTSSVHHLVQENVHSSFHVEDRLTGISLENNSLEFLDAAQLPPNLFQLYLSNNKLRWLPQSLLDSQPNLKQVSLSGNPWICNCDALKFKKWLASNRQIILDIDNTRCGMSDEGDAKLNGSVMWKLSDLDLCSPTQNLLFILSVCLGVLSFMTFSISASILAFKYKVKIKYFLYSHGFTSVKEEEYMDYDKAFDAFISFSHEDDEFVIREIVAEIEERIPNIRLCLHYRHFTPGVLILTNIIHAVENSKTTMVILSRNFLDSEWCLVEFQTAYMQSLKDKMHRIITVKVGDLPKEMDPTIEAYIKTRTYLTWGETDIWKKLLFVLPSPQSSDENQVARNVGDNDIVFHFSFSDL